MRMRNILFISLFSLFSMLVKAENFNHSAVKIGKITESCYHNPCSVAKIKGFRQLQKSPEQSMLELTLLGGKKEWKKKKIIWNKHPHKVYIICSKTHPTISIDGQSEVLPLSPDDMIPGVLMSDAELYFLACHAYKGNVEDGVNKFGYHAITENN